MASDDEKSPFEIINSSLASLEPVQKQTKSKSRKDLGALLNALAEKAANSYVVSTTSHDGYIYEDDEDESLPNEEQNHAMAFMVDKSRISSQQQHKPVYIETASSFSHSSAANSGNRAGNISKCIFMQLSISHVIIRYSGFSHSQTACYRDSLKIIQTFVL